MRVSGVGCRWVGESAGSSVVDGLSGVSGTVAAKSVVSNLNVSGVRVSIFRFLESVLGGDGCGGGGGVGGSGGSFGMAEIRAVFCILC